MHEEATEARTETLSFFKSMKKIENRENTAQNGVENLENETLVSLQQSF